MTGQPTIPHICVCICTYKRPELLRRLLEKLENQETHDAFTYSAVVADNDAARSAESLVAAVAGSARIPITYCSEPRQNIALVRNKALEHAHGEFIAFIDDDEFPTEGWLFELFSAEKKFAAAGVLGPVRPHFEAAPPTWVLRGRFCERPEHPTGMVIQGHKCRTGNVLFRRCILDGVDEPFREQFGTGGEDVDFFCRMNDLGHHFVWAGEAIAYETVPPSRLTRRYMLTRALLRGKSTLKMKTTGPKHLLLSAVAVPTYALMLPITLFLGQHVVMRYLIRLCDHAGRLLAVVGLNPVSGRPI